MLPSMARAEVIEYTNEFDGGDSTSIEHVWYNRDTERMTVRFKAGGTYSYDGVPVSLYDDFADSDSLGQFFRVNFRATGETWAGAKHNDRTTEFKYVPPEGKPVIETDLDALKAVKLTAGKGKEFKLHFTYSANGEMTVRAPDLDAAMVLFQEYMMEKGFTAKVNGVFITLE
jgi:hypothetical protein